MIPNQSEIREVIDVLGRTLPGQAVHTLAEEGEPYADQLSIADINILFEAESHSIRHIVRHAVFELLRTHAYTPGDLFDCCRKEFQGARNPLLETIRSMCRTLPH